MCSDELPTPCIHYGSDVTERSEGTIKHSTIRRSGAERQRGGAVTGSMPGRTDDAGCSRRRCAKDTDRTALPGAHRFAPGRYRQLSASRSCRNHPKNRPAFSWRHSRDSCAHSIFRGLGSKPFGTQCRVSQFARENRSPSACLGSATSLGNHAAIPQQACRLSNCCAPPPNSKAVEPPVQHNRPSR